MRVLRIDSWDGQPGGAQEYVRTVSTALAASGHPQRLLQIVSQAPSDPRPDERYLRVPAGGLRRRAADLIDDLSLTEAIRQEVDTFHPDVVHLHHFDALFTPLARALAADRTPLVFTAHDAELVCPISTLLRPGNVVCDGGVRPRCLFTGCHVGLGGPYNLRQAHEFDTLVKPRVARYLCPSIRLREYLEANGFRPAVHLPPFVELPPAVVERPSPPPPAGPPRIGFLGRLEPYKGVQVLLRAAAQLGARRPDLVVDIAGDGPYRAVLEGEARRLGLQERVRFRGELRGAEKDAWFEGITLLAVPSLGWENLGFVAIEALARGRPVVATNFGGLPDVVQDRESGRLVPVDDPGALAAAVDDLLSGPARASAWGREGRRRVLERFDRARHLARLLEIYQQVASGAPAAR